jgi:aconitate hydratase
MIHDEQMLRSFYEELPAKLQEVRAQLKRPLTLGEKILFTHLAAGESLQNPVRGHDYLLFSPDRVAMQDATAQMALLQFMLSGRNQVAVPTTVHCDHLIMARHSAEKDLQEALDTNREVYDFLQSASRRYGIGFWKPGAGIIHQIIYENSAFPGGMIIRTDSHTPNAGGLGMAAIGVGGADAVDVMAGMPWELKLPRLIGVKLTGSLSGWASPKDVILKLAGLLTVKGATNAIIEYFGPGTTTLSATGKATICNMGAEMGATTSIFPFDEKSAAYLTATGRALIAEKASVLRADLQADPEVLANPGRYYVQVIEIDLSSLEPYINGPFTPDAAVPLSEMASYITQHHYPAKLDVGLIGSCTNSSYEDLSRAASVIRSASAKGIRVQSQLLINPGSEKIKQTAHRDGLFEVFESAGAVIMANACGPCIGQWQRENKEPDKPNSILSSFNRNFARRNDGNPNTHAFISSPELVAAMSLAGNLAFNPLKDSLLDEKGKAVYLEPPTGSELPPQGFEPSDEGYLDPSPEGSDIPVVIDPSSERLQRLEPFPAWDGQDMERLALLIKVKGKCTTDHISMAGPWLRFRGHLDHISDNLLMGAVNAFNLQTNAVFDPSDGSYKPVSAYARRLKAAGKGSIIVAEDNYGEGSSREHAAMEPRYLNVKAVLAKSFARIHEPNLKKQGILALTFADKADYDKIREDDEISLIGLNNFEPGKPLLVRLHHNDGTTEEFEVRHSYNETQIEWFKAGSALNAMKMKQTNPSKH